MAPNVGHQSLVWTILNHISYFIQGEVLGFRVLLDILHPRSTRTSECRQFSELLRSWHLFLLAFTQFAQTWRNAMLLRQ